MLWIADISRQGLGCVLNNDHLPRRILIFCRFGAIHICSILHPVVSIWKAMFSTYIVKKGNSKDLSDVGSCEMTNSVSQQRLQTVLPSDDQRRRTITTPETSIWGIGSGRWNENDVAFVFIETGVRWWRAAKGILEWRRWWWLRWRREDISMGRSSHENEFFGLVCKLHLIRYRVPYSHFLCEMCSLTRQCPRYPWWLCFCEWRWLCDCPKWSEGL